VSLIYPPFGFERIRAALALCLVAFDSISSFYVSATTGSVGFLNPLKCDFKVDGFFTLRLTEGMH
jgi:hypothetical protein